MLVIVSNRISGMTKVPLSLFWSKSASFYPWKTKFQQKLQIHNFCGIQFSTDAHENCAFHQFISINYSGNLVSMEFVENYFLLSYRWIDVWTLVFHRICGEKYSRGFFWSTLVDEFTLTENNFTIYFVICVFF